MWVLWLALVGLVSMAESRSINYEYEDKQGLDSEQKGYAGDVTGKYETMDHNGNVVEVKYIADHMGFRLMDELEVTDKKINSPNAELEIEPTEHKTQTKEQTTNEPIDSSVILAEQKMETNKQSTLEDGENKGEEAAEENTKIGKQLGGDENVTEVEEAGVEAEAEIAGEEAEVGEVAGGDAEAEVAEGGEAEVGEAGEAEDGEAGEETEGKEEENGEAEGEEAEGEEAEAEAEEGEEAEAEEGEEAEAEEGEEEETEGEEVEAEETEEGEEGEAEGEEAEGEDDEAEGEDAEAEEEEATVEEGEAEKEITEEEKESETMTVEDETEPIESGIESETSPIMEQEEELAKDGESDNEITINKRIGEDMNYRLTEILQMPTAEFETISVIPQNRMGFEKETAGRSAKAKSLLSVQNIDNTRISDGRYKQLREILIVPSNDYIRMPQPLQAIDVNNRKLDVSNVKISEVNHEINVLPKRMISITSKHLSNINPGTVMIEKSSTPEFQSNPEVVLVHMKEPGRLTIEAHPVPVENKVAIEPFSRRSSMKIESDKINIIEEPKLIVREVFTSEGSEQSHLLESQPKIETIKEPLVTITSKQLNNVNPGTVMIERTSISGSQSNPEVVLVRMEESGKLTIEAQPVKKEIAVESFSKRTSMEIEPFQQLIAQSRIETIKAEPLVTLHNYPKPSKVNLGLLPIPIKKSLALDMPTFSDNQEIVIETDVIENIPIPMALIQPAVTKTHVLKKISDKNMPKQILRFAPKPTPVLLQQTPSIHSFGKAPTLMERISQQPTPKEVRIIEVRSAPKPMTILQVNPNGQLNIFEDEQVIYDNKNTKITREVIAEDVTSSEIQSFKVREFVRF